MGSYIANIIFFLLPHTKKQTARKTYTPKKKLKRVRNFKKKFVESFLFFILFMFCRLHCGCLSLGCLCCDYLSCGCLFCPCLWRCRCCHNCHKRSLHSPSFNIQEKQSEKPKKWWCGVGNTSPQITNVALLQCLLFLY